MMRIYTYTILLTGFLICFGSLYKVKGQCPTITVNSYAICPVSTTTVTIQIDEDANACIPSGSSGTMEFGFNGGDYSFVNNGNLTVAIGGDDDLGDNTPPTIAWIDATTIRVSSLITNSGGGGQNKIDNLTITVDVTANSAGSGVIERTGGTFVDFPAVGVDVANLNSAAMTYSSSDVFQSTTASIPPFSTNQQILRIELVTANSCTPFNATEFDINTTGSSLPGTDLSSAKIYYTGTSSTFSPVGLFGTQASPNGTFTITGTQALVQGTNYFWLAYDLPSGATINNVVDAECTEITMDGGIGAKVPTTSTPGPGGTRQIKSFLTETDGNWNVAATWSILGCAGGPTVTTPGPADDAIICTGKTVTLTADVTVKSLVIEGILDMNDGAGPWNITVTENLTVNGTIIDGGNITLSGLAGIIDGTGTITLAGANEVLITADHSIASTANLTISGGGTGSQNLNLNPDPVKLINNGILSVDGITTGGGPATTTRELEQASGSTLKVGAGNWSNKVNLDADNVSNTVQFTTTQTIELPENSTFWDVFISGGTVTFPNAVISMKGVFTSNSTTAYGTGTVTMAGASAQNLGGTTVPTFNNLIINNTTGVNLISNVNIGGTLTLTSGNVVLGTNNLIITSGNAISGGSSSSYVKTDNTGVLTINGIGAAANRTFMVGNSSFNPINLSVTAGPAENFSVRVYDDVTDDGAETGTAYTSDVLDRTWMVSELTALGNTVDLTIYWDDATDELAGFDRTNAHVAHYTGGSWDRTKAYSAAVAEDLGDANLDWKLTTTGFTSFSPFGLGDNSGPLPVKMVEFIGELNQSGEVELQWETSVELFSDYFIVERSVDNLEYEKVGILNAAGFSNINQNYSFFDRNPPEGIVFYRLNQVDYDGKSEYFSGVKIINSRNESGLINPGIHVYPNPNNGKRLNMEFVGFQPGEEIVIAMVGQTGQVIYSKFDFVDYQGSMQKVFDFDDQLPPGVYVILACADSKYINQKVVIY